MKAQIKKQIEFVEWLKSKSIYNPSESAEVMRKTMAVWIASKEDNQTESCNSMKQITLAVGVSTIMGILFVVSLELSEIIELLKSIAG